MLVFAGILYMSLAVAFTGLRIFTHRTLNQDGDDVESQVSESESDEAEIPLNA